MSTTSFVDRFMQHASKPASARLVSDSQSGFQRLNLVSHRDEPSMSRHASALERLTGFGLHDRQDIRCLDVLVELLLL